VLVVVGSKSSSNSNRCVKWPTRPAFPGYLVDGPEHLHREWFDGAKTVGVTAGASAPEILVQGVITQLREWGGEVVEELKGGGTRDLRAAQDAARSDKAGRQPFVGWFHTG
jgi:4-hydroxy-3-methylbut-2-enyl diphosphate reductase